MQCIYCDNKKLYELKSGQLKCSRCKKKFSVKKIATDLALVKCFCSDLSINAAARTLHLNYTTVKLRYELFRNLIASFLENEYQDKTPKEYDEYIYLPQSKKKIKENIFDAQNFLTFHYDDKIYNLLMPNLKMYKKQFLDDGAQTIYFKEFSKFMLMNKISKTQKRENTITKFWLYFETSILKYKGVKYDNFMRYLKEIEFKFNYNQDKREEILMKLFKYLHNL
jgi:transposase-like protein